MKIDVNMNQFETQVLSPQNLQQDSQSTPNDIFHSNSAVHNDVDFNRAPPRRFPLHNGSRGKKPRRNKCVSIFLCTPSKLYLIATILLTAFASFLLSYSLTSDHWEIMTYDPLKVEELSNVSSASGNLSVITWLWDGKVPKIERGSEKPVFLLPIRSGVWTSCIDITESEYSELKMSGFEKPHCVDHLNPSITKPTEARASWQHRMQNLGIACAMVCLILLGSAVLVGLFGVFRPQISAVLVTGVIYMLACLFALFTLTIVHLKHKNRKEREPLDVWTRLIPPNDDEFQSTRLITHGWSLKLAWAGNCVCLLASLMWVLLSKIMRYNPNPLSL